MKDFLQRYKVKLETIGPVHIGSGESIRKNQWILNYKRNVVVMIDFGKFIDFLMKSGLVDKYEDYIMEPRPMPMFKWLSEHDISQKNIDEFTLYTLDVSGLNLKNGNIKDMQLAMKDSYGKPYIPGSTLKGAIRNSLLAARISSSNFYNKNIVNEIRTYDGREKQFLSREKSKVEVDFFYTKDIYEKQHHAVNDEMSGIRVSDSTSVSLDRLTLCQKIDINTIGKESELPLVRECIMPGTTFEFDLTIDKTETNITISDIEKSINLFLKDYNDMFLSSFKDEKQYNSNVLYLGGGCGFPTKTVLNQILKNEKDRVRLVATAIDKTLPRKMRRHNKDHIKGVSPTVAKLTEIDGRLLQMGACKIDFTEI